MALNSYMQKLFEHKFGSCNWYTDEYSSRCFFFAGVLYIKIRRFSREIELRCLIGKTLMEPLSNASAEKSLALKVLKSNSKLHCIDPQ
ncbi:hypothetical protein Bca4012_063289 [Brassica carinata]